MAQTYTAHLLSGSTNGRGIKVAATATAGTLIHTADATAVDVVTLYAQNDDADGETRTLTLEWGGASDPDDLIVVPVPCKAGPVLVAYQLPISGGLVVRAFADEANDVIIFGNVSRVTTT